MTTQTKDTQNVQTTRKLDRRIQGVETMKTGLRVDFGHEAPAYIARSVHSGDGVVTGARVVGEYHSERDSGGDTFARVTSVQSVIPAPGDSPDAPAEERITHSATVDIKNIQQADSGYLVWSKNQGHRRPTFVPYHRLAGVNIFRAQVMDIEFYENGAGRLIVSALKVVSEK